MKRVKFAFLLLILTYIPATYLKHPVHSEGIGIISDWGEIISGVDFERDKFIYSKELENKINVLGNIFSLKILPFFPHLKIELFGRELTVSWIFYYTPFIPLFIKEILRPFESFELSSFYKLTGHPIYLTLFMITLHMILFTILTSAIYLFLSERFYDIKSAFLLCILFLTFTPAYYSLVTQLHHLQCSVFFMMFIYFLKARKDILSGVFGGLTLYSYLPASFAVAGALIYDFFKFSDFRSLLKKFLIILAFVVPYLIHFYLAIKVDFKNVYGCSDCIIYDINKNLKYMYTGGRTFAENFQLLVGRLAKLPSNLKATLIDIKESFSISDIYKRYGMIYDFPPLKKLADIFILVHLIVLCYGFVFLHPKDKDDILLYATCFAMYTIFSGFFVYVPKMLYILLPLYAIVATKVYFEFKKFSPTLNKIFIISALIRIIDIAELPNKYLPYLKESEVNKIIEFAVENIEENKIAQYCFPLPFKLYSYSRYNPPAILTFLQQESLEWNERIYKFIIRKFRFLIIDTRVKNEFAKVAESENFIMKTLLKSTGYEVVEFIRISEHSIQSQ